MHAWPRMEETPAQRAEPATPSPVPPAAASLTSAADVMSHVRLVDAPPDNVTSAAARSPAAIAAPKPAEVAWSLLRDLRPFDTGTGKVIFAATLGDRNVVVKTPKEGLDPRQIEDVVRACLQTERTRMEVRRALLGWQRGIATCSPLKHPSRVLVLRWAHLSRQCMDAPTTASRERKCSSFLVTMMIAFACLP